MMTYYDILEISDNASEEVVRVAYKALCKKYHPDVFKGDSKEAEVKMKQINEAFEVLSDTQKRKEYDTFLHNQTPNFTAERKKNRTRPRQPKNSKEIRISQWNEKRLYDWIFSHFVFRTSLASI